MRGYKQQQLVLFYLFKYSIGIQLSDSQTETKRQLNWRKIFQKL